MRRLVMQLQELKKIGMNDEKINELVRAIYGQFDMKSVPEAEDIYRESDY